MKVSRKFVGSLVSMVCICAGVIFLARTFGDRITRHPMTVKAVAHQWWWEFDYPSLGIKTSDVLYLPSGTDVRLELASADVIHSFWIVGMRDPVDIFPGKTRQLDLIVKSPGELHGNCDSGCGCNTVCMRFRVLTSDPRNFGQWAARERTLPTEFKPPPRTGVVPACALNTGHDGHAAHESASGRLQRLLDGDEPTADRRSD